MFAHEPVGDTIYSELPNDSLFAFEQGRAYWLVTKDAHQIGTGPDRGETTPTDSPFAIVLEPGFNLIGNPFNFGVAWDSMMVDTLTTAEAEAAMIVKPPRGRIPSQNRYNDPLTEPVEFLEPFEGYWVLNETTSQVVLKIPPAEALPVGSPVSAAPLALKAAAPPEGQWHLRSDEWSWWLMP